MHKILTELAEIQKQIEELPHKRAALIARCRAANITWREIAEATGLTGT